MGEHDFVGRLDRWCEVCGFPDRDGIHHRAAPKMGDSPAAPDTDIHDARHPPAPSLEQISLKTAPALLAAMAHAAAPAAPDQDAADVEFGCAGAEKSGEPVFMVRTKAARSVLTRNRALEEQNDRVLWEAARDRTEKLQLVLKIAEHNTRCGRECYEEQKIFHCDNCAACPRRYMIEVPTNKEKS